MAELHALFLSRKIKRHEIHSTVASLHIINDWQAYLIFWQTPHGVLGLVAA